MQQTLVRFKNIFPDRDDSCVLCSRDGESSSQLLLHCEFPMSVCHKVLACFKVQIPPTDVFRDWLLLG